jgi:hypothetical protein
MMNVLSGLAQSLFDLLDSPGATLDLNIQYRMNQTLADLANHLTYKVGGGCRMGTISKHIKCLSPVKASKSSIYGKVCVS